MTYTSNENPVNRPTVLIFDPITWVLDWSYEIESEALSKLGVDLLVPHDRQARDDLLEEAHVVVVSSVDDLTAEHIDRLASCVGILCYSAGMDAVDLDAAACANLPVRNIRASTADVADHAMTLLLAAWRRLPEMIDAARSGDWDHGHYPHWRSVPRLEGRRLGIFGPGAIGKAVASRARAFGMTTLATYRRPEVAKPDLPHVPLEELFTTCDAVVLTASLNPSTEGAINRSVLAHGKGAILVNVGRGGLVVEQDLADALDAGTISYAALDVRSPEPPDPASDLLTDRSDVIITPHTAGLTSDALLGLHLFAVEEISAFLEEADLI